MMRLVFWLILLTALVVAFALVLRADHGYVLIVFPPWRVEMSLALVVALLLMSYVLFYVAARLLRAALRLPRDLRAWREQRRRSLAEGELQRAVGALLAGEASHALKLARQAKARTHAPLASLIGARAALDLGEAEAARQLLAELQTEVGELNAARQALERALAPTGGQDAAAASPTVAPAQVAGPL